MAVKFGKRSEFRFPAVLVQKARQRARTLGYSGLSEYLRCVISQELRAPRLPSARSLLGRTSARDLAESRPKRSVGSE